jgi:hypothetical protein
MKINGRGQFWRLYWNFSASANGSHQSTRVTRPIFKPVTSRVKSSATQAKATFDTWVETFWNKYVYF